MLGLLGGHGQPGQRAGCLRRHRSLPVVLLAAQFVEALQVLDLVQVAVDHHLPRRCLPHLEVLAQALTRVCEPLEADLVALELGVSAQGAVARAGLAVRCVLARLLLLGLDDRRDLPADLATLVFGLHSRRSVGMAAMGLPDDLWAHDRLLRDSVAEDAIRGLGWLYCATTHLERRGARLRRSIGILAVLMPPPGRVSLLRGESERSRPARWRGLLLLVLAPEADRWLRPRLIVVLLLPESLLRVVESVGLGARLGPLMAKTRRLVVVL